MNCLISFFTIISSCPVTLIEVCVTITFLFGEKIAFLSLEVAESLEQFGKGLTLSLDQNIDYLFGV